MSSIMGSENISYQREILDGYAGKDYILGIINYGLDIKIAVGYKL